jgi:hypothetical protein
VSLIHIARPLAVVVLMSCGCRSAPPADRTGAKSDGQSGSAKELPEQETMATAETCGPGFRGRRLKLPGELLQRETAQTQACPGDECPAKALGMITTNYHRGKTCAEVREKLLAKPIVDAWGAQARVTCNGEIVQSTSAGRDGKIGTCDDLSEALPISGIPFSLPRETVAREANCGPRFRGKMIPPLRQIVQRETAQTKTCLGEDCERLTLGLMSARYRSGDSCDEVRENMTKKPLTDGWGAQVRVVCNGVNAQAISAGRDGKIGTCDDLAMQLSMGKATSTRLKNTAVGGGSNAGSLRP